MSKKGMIWLLILMVFSTLTYAEIHGSIGLGDSVKYFTKDYDVTITLNSIDVFRERAYFEINGQEINLLPFQRVNVSGIDFMLIGWNKSLLKDVKVHFLIIGNTPFGCIKQCDDNRFVDFVRTFDAGFELCKRNCSAGCDLYKEEKCVGNEVQIVNNCGHKLELLKTCRNDCIDGECTNCGDGFCDLPESYFNCGDCSDRPGFCIVNGDCRSGESCINGLCSRTPYVLGDGICSLPQEDCSSEDCSCENEDIVSKGKDDYPIILLHGFASSPSKLKKMQRALSYNLGYENGGLISYIDIDCPTTNSKVVYIASYYEEKDLVFKRERMKEMIQKTYMKVIGVEEDEKTTFVEIFSEAVDKVKACANVDKVNIVAHSMGGLVTRSYLLEDDNIKNINKLIFVSSPNHGDIYGTQTYELFKGLEAPLGDNKKLLKDCSSVGMSSIVLSLMDGRDVSGECKQITEAGKISNPILQIDETPGLVEYYTIAGNIDGIGDGMVPVESVRLDGAIFNRVAPCNHFKIKEPSCTEAYISIVNALGYRSEEMRKNTFVYIFKEFVISSYDSIVSLFE